MKRFVITLLAAMLIGGVASAQVFPDVPENHWAEDAVERIAGLGIVIGFPDGTFRGNEAFTRYQAALVVSRLLDVIDGMLDDLEARLATQIDDAADDAAAQLGTLRSDLEGEIASLRAAMQDLAGDVASQGVRLAAAESAIAGISDEVAATAARVDALEAAMADAAVLRDLQNQIAALRVGVDTAEAQAAAAAERADAAYDLALQALAEADQNRADIAALNRVVQLLGQRLDELGVPTPAPMPDLTAIDRLAGDIANIREFVILLRRDQVALRDRVAALEAADAAMTARVDDIEGRLEALERTALQISGSITVTYNAIRFGGCPTNVGVDCGFDVDRVYGTGFPRQMGDGRSVFTTGAVTTGPTAERPAQRRAEFRASPGISTTFSISVVANQAFDGRGAPRMLDEFGAVAELDFVEVATPDLLDPDGDVIMRPYVLRVRSFMSTFSPIGMDPITFTFGEEVSVRFTPYVFDIRDEAGWVAHIGAPDFLAFLNPTLTVGYFDPGGVGATNRTGVRATFAPTFGDAIVLSGGFSYARSATGTGDLDPATTVEEAVWGVDAQLGLINLIGLEFEYATNTDTGSSIMYVRASVDGDGLPIINMLRGNYRSIAENWASDNEGIFSDPADSDDAFPFEEDQTGFGVEASLGLFIIDVGAYFDSYSVAAGDTVSAFGASTGLDLFAGFSITGFYEMVTVNGAPADNNDGLERESQGYTHLDGEYETQFGVRLAHDGAADNALIRGLNLAVEYRRFNVGFTGSDLTVDADYALNIAIVTLNPYVGYRMFDDDAGGDFTQIRAGTSVSTTALDLGFVRPSLVGAVNFRSAAYGTAGFTSSETQWSVGLVLDQFIFGEYSTLTARYGSYTGVNTTTFWTDGLHGGPGVGSDWDADRGGASTQTSGYEIEWNYFDLTFAYGTYTTSDTVLGPDRTAQQFRVRYSVNF